MDPRRPWPPYAKLRATRSTALPTDRPVREIRLTLDGDMERYVWFLNNKPLSESDSIRIREGEVVRFIMINRTMMHHPMHLHGHFFRVINGQGDYAPLKHTVDVAPMSTTVIEFHANEVGDWFFHCHLLYHMKSGMTRVVHYEDFPLAPELAAPAAQALPGFLVFLGAGRCSQQHDGGLSEGLQHPQYPDGRLGGGLAGGGGNRVGSASSPGSAMSTASSRSLPARTSGTPSKRTGGLPASTTCCLSTWKPVPSSARTARPGPR